MIHGGYAGSILEVDLSRKQFIKKPVEEAVLRKFLGGKGLGAEIIYDRLGPKTDPLGSENCIVVATGPLTGTFAPTMASKYVIVTKSPLTNIFLDTNIGGFFGAELKYAGYDALIIHGRSEAPVYLLIEDSHLELRSTKDLWGMGSIEVQKAIKDELGQDVRVISIGPAGERLVKFACIVGDFYRNAGRGGAGAVMGSKGLKAIAVRGTGEIEINDLPEFEMIATEVYGILLNNLGMQTFCYYGTSAGTASHNEQGIIPTRNFQSSVFDKIDGLDPDLMREKMIVADKSCFGCPITSWKYSHIKSGPYADTIVVGPEYETSAMLGANCGINDIEAVARANMLCDDLGIDTISAGVVIGFAMECYERGLIKENEYAGPPLNFGNAEAMLWLINKIAARDEIGNTLAEGVKVAAERIGKGSEKFAMHVKGLEMPGQHPSSVAGMALAFATSDRGACHLRAWTVTEEAGAQPEIGWPSGQLDRLSAQGKAPLVKFQQDKKAVIDSIIACEWACWIRGSALDTLEHHAGLLNAATGWNLTVSDLMKIGERIYNLTRAFNVREGINRKHDTLPDRIFTDPLPSGPAQGNYVRREDFEKMLEEYYAIRGWDKDGRPTLHTLTELDLKETVPDL